MRFLRPTLVLLLLVVVGSALEAEPRIEHAGLRCIAPGTFALVLSIIDPDEEVQTAKVYFRSVLYPDFYYVEMRREGDGDKFVGILPQVAPETPQILYYVEVVDQVFDSVRSAEFDPIVGNCKKDPAAAFFTGAHPGIVVGATTAGAAAIPPGFSAAGIVGAITAAGAASGLGGGISTAVVVTAAAGAAGVGGVVVAAGNGAETTTTSGPVSAPPPSVTTTTSATTTVPPGPTTSVVTTTIVGPSTTTSTAPGPTTSTSMSTSTSSTTTTVTSGTLNAGCFTVERLSKCSVRVDATCVAQPVDRYDWVLDTENEFQRITITNGPAALTQTWPPSQCDEGHDLVFRLTVYRGAQSSTSQKTLPAKGALQAPRDATPASITLQSRLELPSGDGSGSGRVLVDGVMVRLIRTDETAQMPMALAAGVHELEAVVARADGAPGAWSFSFPGAPLRAGSLRPVEGIVLGTSPSGITFRLSGAPGERVRLRFELGP
jgi:hypothetical protein